MFSLTRFVALSLALLGVAVEAAPSPAAPGLLSIPAPAGATRPGGYIVTLKKDAIARRGFSSTHRALLSAFTGSKDEDTLSIPRWFAPAEAAIKYEWPRLSSFAGTFSDAALNALRASGDVEAIEHDTIGGISELVTQTDAPWGLSRISQTQPLESKDDGALDFAYSYDSSAGQGVDIYILDTGITIEHTEFEGRARWGATFGPFDDVDVHGHGTHVAGTAAGKRFGVAKAASLVAVRVVNDTGNAETSDAIAAVNWIIEEVTTRTHAPSVISNSLWFYASDALDAAFLAAIDAGIHVVAAGGNFRVEAFLYSPARIPEIITVGSTTINDTMSWFNNHGPPIDVLAPGENVISALNTEPNGGYISLTGTSMAAPHVAGLVAYLVALEGNKPPADVLARIKELDLKGIITDPTDLPPDTPNEFVNNGVTVHS